MTSRVSYFKIITNGVKRHLWYGAICFLMFFISFPLYAMLSFNNVRNTNWETVDVEYRLQNIKNIQTRFQNFVGAGDFLVMLCVMAAALLAAWCGLSWLHSRKKMDLIGSLPVKREMLLLTESVSMLLLFVIPYLANMALAFLVGAAKGILTGKAFLMGIVGIGIHLLYFVVLYLCGTVAMLLTGKILTGILGTLVFLGFGPAVYGILSEYPRTFLDTYVMKDELFARIATYTSPVGSMISVTNRLETCQGVKDGKIILWNPLLIAVVMGIIFVGLSIWLVKIRPTEAAEQSMAFAKTEGIIKACMLYPLGLGGGLFFKALGYENNNENFWLWFGILFALFLGSILMEVIYHLDRKRIFAHKMWTGIAVGATVITAAVFVFDLTGYDRWLPEKDNVEHAVLSLQRYWCSFPDGSSDSYEYLENNIEEFTADSVYELAEAGVANLERAEDNGRMTRASVIFQLKSGRIVKRSYQVDYALIKKAEKELYQSDAYRTNIFLMIFEDPSRVDRAELCLKGQMFYLKNLNTQEKQKLAEIYLGELRSLEYEELYAVNSGSMEFYDEEGNVLSNGGRYPLNENFKKTVGFLKEKGMNPKFSFAEENVQKLLFNDNRQLRKDGEIEETANDMAVAVAETEWNGEDLVMEDPDEIAKALEGLVCTDGRQWYMNEQDEFSRDLEVSVEFVAENGELVTGYGLYRNGEIPESVERFLQKNK